MLCPPVVSAIPVKRRLELPGEKLMLMLMLFLNRKRNLFYFRDCAGACGLNVALTIKDEQVNTLSESEDETG